MKPITTTSGCGSFTRILTHVGVRIQTRSWGYDHARLKTQAKPGLSGSLISKAWRHPNAHSQTRHYHPREVFKPAIIEGSSAVLLSNTEPSREDIQVTERMSLKILSITFV